MMTSILSFRAKRSEDPESMWVLAILDSRFHGNDNRHALGPNGGTKSIIYS